MALFRFAATAEFLLAIRNFPRHKAINFTFHDFYQPAEMEKFLQLHTRAINPLNKQNAKDRVWKSLFLILIRSQIMMNF